MHGSRIQAVDQIVRQIRHTARASIASPWPDRPHLLGRLRLDADLVDGDDERAGDALAHRRDVRREPRRLRDHGRVDVADLPAGALDAPRRLGEQRQRVGALVLHVGVGEVMADVAERGGAEQRVGDRVAERVGVGVAGQAVRVRDLDAAEDELPAGDERVRVPALADAPDRAARLHARAARRASSASAIAKSPGCVTLMFSAEPGTSFGLRPIASIAAGLVGRARGFAPSASASTPKRNICGVCACQTSSRGKVATARSPSACFSVSATGSASRPPMPSLRQASIERLDPLGANQATRGVVDEHPVVRASRRGRRAWRVRRRRSRARVEPPQRASARRGSIGSRRQALVVLVVGRDDDQDPAQPRHRHQRRQRVGDERPAGDLDVLLGDRRAGADAAAGARDERVQAADVGRRGGHRRGSIAAGRRISRRSAPARRAT